MTSINPEKPEQYNPPTFQQLDTNGDGQINSDDMKNSKFINSVFYAINADVSPITSETDLYNRMNNSDNKFYNINTLIENDRTQLEKMKKSTGDPRPRFGILERGENPQTTLLAKDGTPVQVSELINEIFNMWDEYMVNPGSKFEEFSQEINEHISNKFELDGNVELTNKEPKVLVEVYAGNLVLSFNLGGHHYFIGQDRDRVNFGIYNEYDLEMINKNDPRYNELKEEHKELVRHAATYNTKGEFLEMSRTAI